jgi:chemotaxis protein MotB
MKKNQTKFLFCGIFLVLFVLIPSLTIYAGGSKALRKQLDNCNANVEKLEKDVDSLTSQNSSLSDQISKLNSEKAELQSTISELEREISDKDQEIARLEAELAEAPEPMIVARTIEEKVQEKEAEIIDLRMEKNELESKKNELESNVRNLNREIAQLKSENRTLKIENEKLAQEKMVLEDENRELKEDNDELLTTLEVYEGIQRESVELSDLIMERIQVLLAEEIRDGKVRVFKGTLGVVLDVTAEDMFDVGSVVLNPEGRAILFKVGRLLSELDGYFIGVIGNADSKPIVTPALKKRFPTNWELSAGRGATVTRFLIDVSRVSPSRFISMGLGEFQPIDTNLTVDGRGNNRRVDLVLLPIDVLAAVIVGAEIK